MRAQSGFPASAAGDDHQAESKAAEASYPTQANPQTPGVVVGNDRDTGRLSGPRRLRMAVTIIAVLGLIGWVWVWRGWWPLPGLQALYHFRAGRAELERYHNPQAIRHLQVCLRIWPDDPDVLFLAARASRRARNYAEAERLMEKYQQARGVDDAGSFEQFLLSAERRVDQVTDLCWHYIEQSHPDTPLILEALTRGYLRQYRLGQARMCLDFWQERQPENAEVYWLQGLLHLDYAHARDPAEASCRRALELDPEHEEARLGLAVSLINAKNYEEAAEHLEYLRRRQPDNLSVLVGLAECREGMGELDEPARLLDSVLARQPDLPTALSLRGRIALNQGQLREAETWLLQAVARNPSDRRGRYSLVVCLHQNGREEEAEKQKQQLQQLEEDLKRFNAIVSTELAQKPADPALHCELGQLLLRGGQVEEGVRWLQSALRLDKEYAPAQKAMAEFRQKAGQ